MHVDSLHLELRQPSPKNEVHLYTRATCYRSAWFYNNRKLIERQAQ